MKTIWRKEKTEMHEFNNNHTVKKKKKAMKDRIPCTSIVNDRLECFIS